MKIPQDQDLILTFDDDCKPSYALDEDGKEGQPVIDPAQQLTGERNQIDHASVHAAIFLNMSLHNLVEASVLPITY